MEKKLVRVTAYVLHGDGIKNLTFSMKDPKKLELVYKDNQYERTFTGEEVDLKELRIGYFSEVVLETFHDHHITTLSLVVPSANRPSNAKSIPVKTFAVRTTKKDSLAGPRMVEGQIQTYETYALEGNAW